MSTFQSTVPRTPRLGDKTVIVGRQARRNSIAARGPTRRQPDWPRKPTWPLASALPARWKVDWAGFERLRTEAAPTMRRG